MATSFHLFCEQSLIFKGRFNGNRQKNGDGQGRSLPNQLIGRGGVAQIVAHWLAVRQARVRISGSAPLEEALYRADAMRITRVVLYE
jgi:hypothetical protein